jgi:hypothetical protein
LDRDGGVQPRRNDKAIPSEKMLSHLDCEAKFFEMNASFKAEKRGHCGSVFATFLIQIQLHKSSHLIITLTPSRMVAIPTSYLPDKHVITHSLKLVQDDEVSEKALLGFKGKVESGDMSVESAHSSGL